MEAFSSAGFGALSAKLSLLPLFDVSHSWTHPVGSHPGVLQVLPDTSSSTTGGTIPLVEKHWAKVINCMWSTTLAFFITKDGTISFLKCSHKTSTLFSYNLLYHYN